MVTMVVVICDVMDGNILSKIVVIAVVTHPGKDTGQSH